LQEREQLDDVKLCREARRVWDFLGQTKAALVPLGFMPLCSEVLA
jgi:hypothetical protein